MSTKIGELREMVEDLELKLREIETRMNNSDRTESDRFAALENQVADLLARLPKPKAKKAPVGTKSPLGFVKGRSDRR